MRGRLRIILSPVAQLAERSAVNRKVLGSIPSGGVDTENKLC